MATWGELEHIFDVPLGEKNPRFHQPISSPWKHIEPMKSVDDHFTKIFAQLYLKENLDQDQSSSSPSPPLSPSSSLSSDFSPKNIIGAAAATSDHEEKRLHRRTGSASSFSSDRSSICDVDDIINVEDSVKNESINDPSCQHEEENRDHDDDHARTEYCCLKRSPSCRRRGNNNSGNNYGGFPPPISCIGRSGKPWVSFQTIRKNGRFILTEVRIPTQEFMHACRENGRLKLHFIHSESEEEEEEEETGENDDGGGDSEAMEA